MSDYVLVTEDAVPTIAYSKGSILLISHDERVPGPFLLESPAQDWKPRLLTDTARTHIYAPDPEDCLLLHYEFTGLVKLDQVICQLPANANVTFLEENFYFEINEEVYHQCVMKASQVSRTESAPENAVPTSNGQMARHLERDVLFACHTDFNDIASKTCLYWLASRYAFPEQCQYHYQICQFECVRRTKHYAKMLSHTLKYSVCALPFTEYFRWLSIKQLMLVGMVSRPKKKNRKDQ